MIIAKCKKLDKCKGRGNKCNNRLGKSSSKDNSNNTANLTIEKAANEEENINLTTTAKIKTKDQNDANSVTMADKNKKKRNVYITDSNAEQE